MRDIGLKEFKKVGPKFLCSGTELMLDIYLRVSGPPPIIAIIPFRKWSGHTCHKYFGVPSEHCSRISD